MPTKSQILHTDPHKVLDLIDGWKTAVAALEQQAETYKRHVERPGGSYWEGATAEAAQRRAAQDYAAVVKVRETVDAAARQISNTISSSLMPPLTNAKQIIENADSHAGVHVNEDLSITYTPPEGTSKETAEANAKTVAAAEAELKADAAKWWAAENDVAAQIRDAEASVGKDLNFGAALFDPRSAMPSPRPPAGPPPATQQAVFPPIPTEPQTGDPSGLGDLLGAGPPEPGKGPPGWQDLLLPTGALGATSKRDAQHQPGSLTEMLNQLGQPGAARAPVSPPNPQELEAAKGFIRDLMRRDGVPPDQIEQRLNTFVARAEEGYGLMGNRVPQAEGRGPGPSFGDGFADRWFATEQGIKNLLGQGGPGAPGVLESWAGLAKGAAEAVVTPPIAGIAKDFLNSPNPAYFAGGLTADAAMTAPSLLFGGEGAAVRAGLPEVEGSGLGLTGGHHFPHDTPTVGDHPTAGHHPGSVTDQPILPHTQLDGAPGPGGLELELRPKEGWTPDQLGAMHDKIERFNHAVAADGGFQQVDPLPRNPVIRQLFLDSLGLDRVPPGMHVDHIRDLQAGGLDTFENMMLLDGSVNTSFGKQLNIQMSQYDQGTIFSLLRLLQGN